MGLTILSPMKPTSLFYLQTTIFVLICYDATSLLVSGEAQPGIDLCNSKVTCHECIQMQYCGWCSEPDFNEKRCFRASEGNTNCREEYFYSPKNKLQVKKFKNLTKVAGPGSDPKHKYADDDQNHEQVKLEHVHLELRPNHEQTVIFTYQQVEDYPLDLYFLMDLSNSMNASKNALSKLGNRLAETMRSLTKDFRIGFGSFIDKVVMPYVSMVPKKLDNPCNEGDCAPPYGYKNVMPLSNNTERFSGDVEHSEVSGNLDGPEGGFDAIMQAVVCEKQIGWRKKARRLLVFATDDDFHYAGDGLLGGIVKPNDGQCHLDPKYHNYTYSNYQDYPSISQINALVKNNSINLIFAVVKKKIDLYKKLSTFIEGSSYGELTSSETANDTIVHLIKTQYQKITSEIEVKPTAHQYFKVSFYSNCLNKTQPIQERNKCGGIKLGHIVQFEVRIELLECPKNRAEWKQSFKIYPVGINEPLTVDVTMLCDCPCEHPGKSHLYQEHSEKCNGNGTLSCGLCHCDKQYFGHKCECNSNNLGSVGDGLSKNCKPANSSIDCSGNGDCVCGQCECYTRPTPGEVIYGDFCECDNYSCDRHDGKLCNDQGTCECGKCVCKDNWTGSACSCLNRTQDCVAPGSSVACSGHGTCHCGKCKCNDDEHGTHYSGRYCESCKTCPDKCAELRHCVICRAYRLGNTIAEECLNKSCNWFELNLVDQVRLDEDVHQNICYEEDEKCRFEFVYKYDLEGKLVVDTQKVKTCPEPVFLMGIILGVIGFILLAGLSLLAIWKILTTIHDKREYAKFEEQRAKAKWNDDGNPIYKPSTSTFHNPTFALSKMD